MSTLAARRVARRPALEAKLRHMAQTLQPLVHAATGDIHPYFPLTIVQFWLLNDEQLNALASFYHQRTPHALKQFYPCPVSWPRRGLGLEDKRRKFGRFIGLRGCETPRRPAGYSRDFNTQQQRQQYHGCGRNCPVAWDNQEVACMPCAMRKVNSIFENGDVPAVGESQVNAWDNDNMDDTATLVDMNVDTMDVDMLDVEPETKPLTVDDIVENAQRARLEANAGEEALRRKTGHY
ncbi:hypothetical protein SBRCBS47491_000576 [Sporothrix bragantina]|uniref:Uncharacterized protein n=1 Tax=Sporothrix bragantina TaxID=671064 RepID=A0ABP0ARD6_9PEZI